VISPSLAIPSSAGKGYTWLTPSVEEVVVMVVVVGKLSSAQQCRRGSVRSGRTWAVAKASLALVVLTACVVVVPATVILTDAVLPYNGDRAVPLPA
jgi:hypothetical protein